MTDLTCIITGHHEGHIAVASLRSFHIAMEEARAAGHSCQPLYVLDRPDETTEALFRAQAEEGAEVMVVDCGDQGLARNLAIEAAEGQLTAFLDADDLWSRRWLAQGLAFLEGRPETHIAHPEFNYFFEAQSSIRRHVDQEDAEFRPDLLRVANYWDALCICPTEIYRRFPFNVRDLQGGWAYEDWFWNCETVAAGMIHKVVPGTVLFKRRQKASQTIRASQNKSMVRTHPLTRYDHPLFAGEAAEGAGR